MKIIFGDLLPGETPIEDASGLLIPGISTRKQLSEAEAEDITSVIEKYFFNKPTFEIAPFEFEWLYELHREMFHSVWAWAGKFRTHNLNIGSPFAQVQERLYNLLDDLKFWHGSGMSLEEQASRLHHVAVQIHPFVNGNGRWSRMLANIWLVLHDRPYIPWPEEFIGSSSVIRAEYLAALKAADQGDYDSLVAMSVMLMSQNKDDKW